MSKRTSNIEALIESLSGFQKEVEVENMLEAALADPVSTQERLAQIDQVLEAFKRFGLLGRDDPRDLHLLMTVGRTYEQFLHLEKAYETYQTALVLAELLGEDETCANLLLRMGWVLSRWDRWEEALASFNRSQEAFRELGDERGEAGVDLHRGIVFHEQGDYEAAGEAYEMAVELAQRADDQILVANASANLAVLATIRGDLDGAVTQYQACLSMYQTSRDVAGQARTYHNLGMTYADQQDWKAATDCFERGFEMAQEQSQLDVMANLYLSRAELMLELGDTSMSAACCARALDIYREIGDHLGEADVYRLLGRVFTLRRQWTTAAKLFYDSLLLNEEYIHPLGASEAHRDLAKMHAVRGHTLEARASFETALSGFRELGAQADVAEVEGLIEALNG